MTDVAKIYKCVELYTKKTKIKNEQQQTKQLIKKKKLK